MRNIAAIAAALALAALIIACEKSDPVAGTGTEIQLSASPADIRLGGAETGKSTITATLFDKSGQLQSGVGVSFSSDTGDMKSHGTRIRTNSRGVAQDDLIVSSADDGSTAKVTVRSGSQKADIDVGVGGVNMPPRASFIINPLPEAHTGAQVAFDAGASRDQDAGDRITEYLWSLHSTNPDAIIPAELQPFCTRPVTPSVEVCDFKESPVTHAVQSQFTRSFSNQQDITVELQVFDSFGAADQAVLQSPLEIHANFPPTANAGPDIIVKRCGTAQFNALASSDADGTIVRYGWNFGDGHISDPVGAQTSHVYDRYAICGNPPVEAPGCAWTVELTVYDNGTPNAPGYLCSQNICTGYLTATDTLKVTVNEPPPDVDPLTCQPLP